MRAAVMHEVGPPSVLKIQSWAKPTPAPGQVLIRVRAFGLNRSEMFTRQGHSPGVKFPRVLGIEATGVVESAPSTPFQPGDIVATCMGGMGRDFDGGYAEYTCVPATQVQKITTKLPWETLGALPEMVQTVWGSLFISLQLKKEDSLLIRGGTTSVGLTAAALAKVHGCHVAATTRKASREAMLKENGADEVYVDNGSVEDAVRSRRPQGYNKVLELVGVTSLRDSLRCASEQGLVCVTGIAGGKWVLDTVNPMELIPTSVGLTVYGGGPAEFMKTPLEEIARDIAGGKMNIKVRAFGKLEDVIEAHRIMEEEGAGGKIVVLVE